MAFVSRRIDPLRDIGGLRVQIHADLCRLPVETGLFVSDIADREPRDMSDVIARDLCRAPRLSGNDDTIAGCEGFARDSNVPRVPAVARREIEERIDHLVRNPVADLVRMSFGNGLARE